MHGYLQWSANVVELAMLAKCALDRNYCNVVYWTLFKEHEDFHCVIDCNIKKNIGKNHGPFQKNNGDAKMIMYCDSFRMDWLHRCNIVCRDFKPSNMLMNNGNFGDWMCCITDFECFIGVVGTRFWRAPEIL
jgi:serine/threonine protein kinase